MTLVNKTFRKEEHKSPTDQVCWIWQIMRHKLGKQSKHPSCICHLQKQIKQKSVRSPSVHFIFKRVSYLSFCLIVLECLFLFLETQKLPQDWQERNVENRHFAFLWLLITLLQLLLSDAALAYPRSSDPIALLEKICYFCWHLTENHPTLLLYQGSTRQEAQVLAETTLGSPTDELLGTFSQNRQPLCKRQTGVAKLGHFVEYFFTTLGKAVALMGFFYTCTLKFIIFYLSAL